MDYPGRVIKIGEHDPLIVAAVKTRLNEVLGKEEIETDRVSLDPANVAFGDRTAAAVSLFQARHVDGRGRPLVQDGEIGSLTWDALFDQQSMVAGATKSLLQRGVLLVASREVGVLEDPKNSNRGPRVEAYLRSVGLGPGYSWCCAFVYWCFQEASKVMARPNPMVKTGSCLYHWSMSAGAARVTASSAVEQPSLVVPGAIFIMSHGGGLGHTGLVEMVEGGLLHTIEGNTDASRTREGGGVYRLIRKVSEINTGYIIYS